MTRAVLPSSGWASRDRLLRFAFGTASPALVTPTAFFLAVALFGAVISVLLLDLPLWILAVLGTVLVMAMRIGIPLGFKIATGTMADPYQARAQTEEVQHLVSGIGDEQ